MLPYAWEITRKCTYKQYKCKITIPLVVSYLILQLNKISDSNILNKQMYVNINLTYWIRTMYYNLEHVFWGLIQIYTY